jgi:hypothetical protein
MNRASVTMEINEVESLLMDYLDERGYFTSFNTLNGKVIPYNKFLEGLKSSFNTGFLGLSSKELRDRYYLTNDYSIYNLIPEDMLGYYLDFLNDLKIVIKRHKIVNEKAVSFLNEELVNLGKEYKKKHQKENKVTPITVLKKFNDNKYFNRLLQDKLERFSAYDEDFLRFKIKEISHQLNDFLPKYYSEKTAYGNTIGCINGSFYGAHQKEILERFKANNVKGVNNVVTVMDKEHLIYRYVTLYYSYLYKDKYNGNDFQSYINKVSEISYLLKTNFREKYEISPYHHLLNLAKKYEEDKHTKYKLSKSEEKITVLSGQLSMFDMLDNKNNIR